MCYDLRVLYDLIQWMDSGGDGRQAFWVEYHWWQWVQRHLSNWFSSSLAHAGCPSHPFIHSIHLFLSFLRLKSFAHHDLLKQQVDGIGTIRFNRHSLIGIFKFCLSVSYFVVYLMFLAVYFILVLHIGWHFDLIQCIRNTCVFQRFDF